MPFYAVAKGRNVGIYDTWLECKKEVNKYFGAKYRKFETKQEAEQFILENKQVDNGDGTSASASTSSSSVKPPKKKTEKTTHPLLIPHDKTDLFVYTDGACSKNGGKNAKAGYGIYFGEGDRRNKSVRLIHEKQTNNVAELTALKEALTIVLRDPAQHITFVTDSKYSIQCLTTYGYKCAKSGWKTDIPNKQLVMETYALFNAHTNIARLLHVMAHTGQSDMHSIGNHYADMLAVNAIDGR